MQVSLENEKTSHYPMIPASKKSKKIQIWVNLTALLTTGTNSINCLFKDLKWENEKKNLKISILFSNSKKKLNKNKKME